MYEIKRGFKTIDGRQVVTYSRNCVGANMLKAEAGTTGYRGGDSGHGGRTYFSLTDLSGTDIRASRSRKADGVQVLLGGDSELDTVIEALKFIVQVLEDQREEYKEVQA